MFVYATLTRNQAIEKHQLHFRKQILVSFTSPENYSLETESRSLRFSLSLPNNAVYSRLASNFSFLILLLNAGITGIQHTCFIQC